MQSVAPSRDSRAGVVVNINWSRVAALPTTGIERERSMSTKPSKAIVERIVQLWRGLFTSSGTNRRGRSEEEVNNSSRGDFSEPGLEAISNKDAAGYRDPATTAGRTAPTDPVPTDGLRRELPDLDDSEDGEYRGQVIRFEDTDQTLAAQDMAAEEERERSADINAAAQSPDAIAGDRSDTSGDIEVGDQEYPSGLASAEDVFNLHNAVGGDDTKADDEVDGIIDTSRDVNFPSGQPKGLTSDNVPDPKQDISDLNEQDELATIDGARSDEFAAGGYAPEHIDQEDIEAASEGDPSIQSESESPAEVDDQHDLEGTRDDEFGSASDVTEDLDQDTPAGIADRQEIEASSRHDAGGLRNDESGAVPGRGDPSTFDDASTGTTEPSRSATGNAIDDEQDALGTTLSYSDETASPFDVDEANLSGQEELTVSDEESERLGTLQSGAIAQRGLGTIGEAGAGMEDETTDSYADFPDEPPPDSPDDAGVDDFAGDDYPSDRRVDPLAGDDPFDTQIPDTTNDYGSSAGDLDTVDRDEELLINRVQEAASPIGGDAGIDRTIDQESIGTSDEHVGGEEPGFVENMQDIDVPSVRDADVPAGAVPGDGTANTPPGYPIKGNRNSMIYHLPEYPSYKGTKPELCFATEADAIAAGFRAPGRRNRGQGKKR